MLSRFTLEYHAQNENLSEIGCLRTLFTMWLEPPSPLHTSLRFL